MILIAPFATMAWVALPLVGVEHRMLPHVCMCESMWVGMQTYTVSTHNDWPSHKQSQSKAHICCDSVI